MEKHDELREFLKPSTWCQHFIGNRIKPLTLDDLIVLAQIIRENLDVDRHILFLIHLFHYHHYTNQYLTENEKTLLVLKIARLIYELGYLNIWQEIGVQVLDISLTLANKESRTLNNYTDKEILLMMKQHALLNKHPENIFEDWRLKGWFDNWREKLANMGVTKFGEFIPFDDLEDESTRRWLEIRKKGEDFDRYQLDKYGMQPFL